MAGDPTRYSRVTKQSQSVVGLFMQFIRNGYSANDLKSHRGITFSTQRARLQNLMQRFQFKQVPQIPQ
jgi:hypothetical protein